MDSMRSKVQVLVSCMFEKDHSIISRTNIQTDAIIINQCNENKVEEWTFQNKKGVLCNAKMYYTTERGLSRSRNMAISKSNSDICLICDDDELLLDNYEDIIINTFSNNPCYDIIAFNFKHPLTIFPSEEMEITFWKTGRLGSWQLAFKRNDKILASPFNVLMGSGTGNGGGEENKFLLDCLSKGAKIKYVPLLIGEVSQTDSYWFHGFNKEYWISRGWVAKMLYGKIKALCYILGQVLLRVKNVDPSNSRFNILIWMLKGWSENRGE